MKFYIFSIFLIFGCINFSYTQVFKPDFSYQKPTENYTGSYIVDVNRDSFPDILYADKRDIYLYLNKGLEVATFEKIHLGPEQSSAKTFNLWDTDSDGDLDILVGVEGKIIQFENKSSENQVIFIRSNKDYYYYGSTSKNVPIFRFAYINEDSLYDMVIAYGKTKISFQKPDKTFYDYEVPKAQYTNVRKIEVLDIDQDNRQDLLFCKLGNQEEYGLFYFLNGNNTFSFQRSIMNGSISDFQLSDFNGDGNLDILTAKDDSLALLSIIENINHDTVFTSKVLGFSSTQVYNAMAFGELNGFPGLDLITSTDDTTNLSLLLNQKENQPSWDEKTLNSASLTKDLFISDLDHDGDDDIIQMLPDDGFIIYERVRTTNTYQLDWNVKTYPNPFTDVITLQSSKGIQSIDIVNINGEVVFHQKNIDAFDYQLSLANFPNGFYIAIIKDLKALSTSIPLIKTN